jgi:hypothetical protein
MEQRCDLQPLGPALHDVSFMIPDPLVDHFHAREERELPNDRDYAEALRQHFGIVRPDSGQPGRITGHLSR